MAAKNVIIWWLCVCLVKVIEATSCDVSLSTGSNIVQLNSNVSLTCSVCNYVFSTIIEYHHNNTLLGYFVFGIFNIIDITLHRVTTSFDNGNMTLTLTIQKFIGTSQGNYTCSILNTTRSATQFVWLKVPVTSVTLTPEDKALNAVEGLPIYSMKCVSSHGRPSPYITWYLDNGTKDTYLDDVNITMYTNVSNSNDVTTSTLSLTPTRSVNNQSIYCNVSNGDFVISSTHRLRLNILTYPSRPIIQYNGTNVNDVLIIKGRNISFECSSIGVPTPAISWTTPSGEVINNTVLTIPIVQNGSYKCSARSSLSPSHGENITATNISIFSVNILYPPKVISCTIGAEFVVSSRIVKVVQNEPFAMNCTSDGNPPPTSYTWLYPDGRQLTETKLTLTSAKSIGNNRYMLQVSNAMKGTFDIEETLGHLNATYTLDILFPPMVPALHYKGSTGMLINTPAINVIRGSQVTILCNASSNPDPRYNWFVDGIQTSYASIWNGTIQSQTKVQCSVSNTMNATGKKSVETSTNSSVQILAMFAPETPTFTFNACGRNVQTKYLKVIQGHYVNGTCITNSYPTSIYSWIPGSYGSLKSFVISTSNASHIGNYTCTATNTMNTTFDGIKEGNTKSSFFLDILVPVDVQSIANATVVLNSNFSLACPYTSSSKSIVSLIWTRNGTIRNIGAGQTLTLPFIKLTDEGYYTCNVSYRLEPSICDAVEDYDESSFYLDVQFAANISRFHAVGFGESSKSITINESQSVMLLCEVDSDPVAYLAVINTTRGSEHLLRELHNNTIYASFGNARCEYDMGVYECKGNNTHNVVQQVRRIEILITCAPRPSPFSPLNTTIYRKTNDSVIITFTIVAYPPPSSFESYIWRKQINNEWVTLQNSSEFFIHISNDRLQTKLLKSQLYFDDFTNYTVHVHNDIGSWEQNFVIRANEQPSAPERFEVVADLVTENSVTIEWRPGFDGGEEQRFVILYKKPTDMAWTNNTLPGAITRIVIDGLSPGTAYEVKMYAENTLGKSDETAVKHVETKSYSDPSRSSAVTAIGAGVGGSIVCVFVIIGVVFVIRRRTNNGAAKQTSQRKFNFKKNGETAYVNYLCMSANADGGGNEISTTSITNPTFQQNIDTPSTRLTHGIQRTPSFMIVPEPLYGNVGDFKLKIKSILVQELRKCTWQCKQDPTDVFRDFYSLDSGLKYETSAACKEVNVPKNRYKNMYPYDKNRVRLPTIDGEESSDFINASFIDGYERKRKYIAAQGPLERTLPDIWRMIVAENIKVIAMVTNTVEDGKRKCFQYWPDDTQNPCQYGDFKISLIRQEKYTDFGTRELQCTRANCKDVYTVYHCHFTAWPDKEVPSTALSLLQFWRKVRSYDTTRSSPWLVHCSAGVGRTGTFIALDYLYEQGIASKEITVHDAVKQLREQRINMVQTKTQYLYLHEVLCEALDPIGSVAINKDSVTAVSGIPDVISEFKRLCEAVDSNATHPTDNEYLAEDDNFRPILTQPAIGKRNVINTVCISTFREQNKLILTPAPTEGITEVNWIWLLHDYNIATVVILHDKIEPYIPAQGQDIITGPFIGKLLTKSNQSHYTEQVVRYKSIAEHDGFDIRVFQFTSWPEHDDVCNTSDLLHLLIAVLESAGDGKVLVQCSDGYTRSGLFAVIWSIVERIKREGEVAVAEMVRLTKHRCQRVITNEKQYLFCHEFAMEYVKGCMTYANS